MEKEMKELIQDLDFFDAPGEPTLAEAPASHPIQKPRKLYIESYGCQMNFSDSEIVASVLKNAGFQTTPDIVEADLVFLNTCSIREKAELTVRNRLNHI